FIPFFIFSCFRHPHALHSFPTRRSSDLEGQRGLSRAARRLVPSDRVLLLNRRSFVGRRGLPAARHLGDTWGWWRMAGTRGTARTDRKSTRLNSSHRTISYAVFCLKKKKK